MGDEAATMDAASKKTSFMIADILEEEKTQMKGGLEEHLPVFKPKPLIPRTTCWNSAPSYQPQAAKSVLFPSNYYGLPLALPVRTLSHRSPFDYLRFYTQNRAMLPVETRVECRSSLPLWPSLLLDRNSHRRKGGQVRFSIDQTAELEKTFETHKYLLPPDRKKLAGTLRLSERQVKTWFQNRRAKWRRLRQENQDIAQTKPESMESSTERKAETSIYKGSSGS